MRYILCLTTPIDIILLAVTFTQKRLGKLLFLSILCRSSCGLLLCKKGLQAQFWLPNCWEVKGISFWRNCGAASVGEWYTKIWFINGVDNVNWPPYRNWKADVSSVSPSSEWIDWLWCSDEGKDLSIRSDEGLTLENVSFSISVRGSIYIINSVDKPNFRAEKSVSLLVEKKVTKRKKTLRCYHTYLNFMLNEF